MFRRVWKGIALFAVIFLFGSIKANAIQVSFSYFFPFQGNFASPIAPLGFDDLGIKFGEFLGISTGLSLYNVGGMNIKGLPFTMDKTATTSFLSLNVPLYLKIILPVGPIKFELKGGGFLFYNFGLDVSRSFDQALAKYLNYATLTSTLTIDNNIGFGWRAGGDITFYVTPNIGIVIGANYLSGASTMNIRGSYLGGASGGNVTNGNISYPNAYLDYTGLVFTIGGEYIF